MRERQEAKEMVERAHHRRDTMDGILNIDKPPGMTSMDLVRRVKRWVRQRRVGHAGTLDPIATGVVPICLGQATRVMEYIIDGTKEYRAVVELGVATDTYDALGKVTYTGDPSGVTRRDVEEALEAFRGPILQVPPMYSALKQRGKRLYELARAGIEVERQPRQVETYRLDLVEWDPPLVTLEVACSRGFYMRSLAHDLGRALGCGAHLKSLVRLRTGPFALSDAIGLAEVERRAAEGSLREVLHPPDAALYHLRAAVVGRRTAEAIRHGRPLAAGYRVPFGRAGDQCRVYTVDGRFLAIMVFDPAEGHWRPDKVFSIHYPELDA